MNKVFFGDCRESMGALIADGVKVQTCVTSPPYWGLRDYGVDGQLGLEATPEEYTQKMVEVFRLVRDMLADDGTLWLNLGDSYCNSDKWGGGGANTGKPTKSPDGGVPSWMAVRRKWADVQGIKPKDLVGIPWRVAFALQADGWYLRSDIIWHKPNPMPESVTDRPTKAHEYLFLLSKKENYYYNAEAIKENSVTNDMRRPYGSEGSWHLDGRPKEQRPNGKLRVRADRFGGNKHTSETTKHSDGSIFTGAETRNKRSVWSVATMPFAGAHFATFPPALIEPCILAGSRPGDIVLDPFFGSGTTGQVAQKLGRLWIGCELQREYEVLQLARTAQAGLVLG